MPPRGERCARRKTQSRRSLKRQARSEHSCSLRAFFVLSPYLLLSQGLESGFSAQGFGAQTQGSHLQGSQAQGFFAPSPGAASGALGHAQGLRGGFSAQGFLAFGFFGHAFGAQVQGEQVQGLAHAHAGAGFARHASPAQTASGGASGALASCAHAIVARAITATQNNFFIRFSSIQTLGNRSR